MSTSRPAPDLAARYGRARPRRRGLVITLCATLALVAGGWLAWTAWFHGSPDATSQLASWEVLGDDEVVVEFDVSVKDGVVAQCRVEAYDTRHAAVGSAVVEVSGTGEDGRISTTIRTTRLATAVEMIGCTTPDQQRPR